jgi:hypothetical protein
MKQALHVLRKDFLYLRAEIAAMILLSALCAWVARRSMDPGSAEVLLYATGAYIIARLVHAEAIPGDTQFWLTRPYQRSALFAAKLMGMALFVNLPIFVSRAWVLQASGFPLDVTLAPLAWSQAVLFLAGMLPIAAIAAVTTSLVPFIFAILVVTAAALGLESFLVPPLALAVRQSLTGSQWVWASIVLLVVVSVAAPALWAQYRWRRTWLNRSVLLGASAVAAAFYAYLPWTAAANIQVAVAKSDFDAGKVRVRLDPSAKQFFSRGMRRDPGFQVDVPLVLEGLTADTEVLPDGITLTFRAADGTFWSSGNYVFPALAKRTQGPGPPILNADVDVPIAFFERAKTQRVAVTGALYFSVFGNPGRISIPIQSTRAAVGDGIYCVTGELSRFICASPFRWPGRVMYADFDNAGPIPFSRTLSYSPFPTGLVFDLAEWRDIGAPRNARHVTVLQYNLLACLRHEFKIDDFPLAAMSTPIRTTPRRE